MKRKHIIFILLCFLIIGFSGILKAGTASLTYSVADMGNPNIANQIEALFHQFDFIRSVTVTMNQDVNVPHYHRAGTCIAHDGNKLVSKGSSVTVHFDNTPSSAFYYDRVTVWCTRGHRVDGTDGWVYFNWTNRGSG